MAAPETGNDVRKLARLVKGISFAMLTTHDSEHGLRSRPMTLQEAEFEGDFWFFTGLHASLADDVRANPCVSLAFADPRNQAYVSASGVGELVFDQTKMRELWRPSYQAWFPLGLEDPELCLLKVHVESADFWESPGSKVVQLLGFAKAALTGHPGAGGAAGKHRHLEFGRAMAREHEGLFWD
jgi:general stress protein 26